MLPEEAIEKMNQGIWVTCGGYTWRNQFNEESKQYYGEYLSFGSYPECIRTTDAHTLNTLKSIATRSECEWILASIH